MKFIAGLVLIVGYAGLIFSVIQLMIAVKEIFKKE